MNITRRTLSGFCRTSLLAGLVGLCMQTSAMALDLETKFDFNIAPQKLATALVEFSRQTKTPIVSATKDVSRFDSRGVTGKMTVKEALKALLAGTKLEGKPTESGAIAVGVFPINTSDASAGTLLLVSIDNEGKLLADAAGQKKSGDKNKADDVEEMIVEEGRIKPFSDANVDIPRTVDDVQPYYVFDSKTIERSAAFNVEDFLKQRLTMNTLASTSSQRTSSGGENTGNTSAFNLRGLGTDKTLVLINGRRGPVSTGDGSAIIDLNGQTDLNAIPLSAIDRIEILPSSASGIYGGSAIGGVINVILKREYRGGEVRAFFDNSWNTDSPRRTVGANYGFGLGKTQVMLNAQWSDAKALLLQDRREMFDRGLANVLRNNPSTIFSSTSPFLGALPNITSSSERINNVTIPDPGVLTLKNGTSLGSRNTYISAGISPTTSLADLSANVYANRGVWNLELPPTVQNPTGLMRPLSLTPTVTSMMISLRRELLSGFEVSLDLSRNRNDSVVYSSVSNTQTSIGVRASSPYNPFNSAVTVSYPNVVSALTKGIESTVDTVSLGLRAKLPYNWVSFLDYSWSKARASNSYSTFDSTTFGANITAGLINPFVDLLQYPLNLDSRYFSEVQYRYTSNSKDFALRGSGPLGVLPWGSPNLTLGFEHRVAATPRNEAELHWPLLPAQDLLWVTFAREQAASSAYAEATIPLIKQDWLPLARSLELQLAGRKERLLVDIGTPRSQLNFLTGVITYGAPTLNGLPFFDKASYTSTNKTVGLKYEPLKGLALRASTSTAFLPPSHTQLLKNPVINTSPSNIVDPRNNNQQVQVSTISGGNPDLRPQNSESLNVGVIWQPGSEVLQGLRFNAEYYRIKQFDAIGTLSAQLMVNNENAYPDRVLRNAAGAITFVDTSMVNLYRRDSSGWDISADYRVDTSVGTFSLSAVESIILDLKNQYSLTLPAFDSVGFPAEGGAAKYKSSAQLLWEHRNLSAGWAARYFGSYKQSGALGSPSDTQNRATNPNAAMSTFYLAPQGGDTIPSQVYHDVFLSYAFPQNAAPGSWGAEILSGTTFQLGVKNVFNTLPPFDVFYDYYISPYGDTRLRSYWLSVKKAF